MFADLSNQIKAIILNSIFYLLNYWNIIRNVTESGQHTYIKIYICMSNILKVCDKKQFHWKGIE